MFAFTIEVKAWYRQRRAEKEKRGENKCDLQHVRKAHVFYDTRSHTNTHTHPYAFAKIALEPPHGHIHKTYIHRVTFSMRSGSFLII